MKNRKPIETQNLNSSSTKGRKSWTHHTKGKWWDRHRTHINIENLLNRLSTNRKFLVYVEDMLSRGNFSVFHLSKCPTSCFILFLPLDTHQVSQENNGKKNFCQFFMSSNVLRVRQPHIRVTSCSLVVTLLFHYLMTMWSGNLGPLFFSLP